MISVYRLIVGCSVGMAMVTGCATDTAKAIPEPSFQSVSNSPFVATNYGVADALIAQFAGSPAGGPLIVATVVNIDALEQSSTLGRLISEQVSARLSQRGFTMIEMKFRSSIYMKRGEGELVLTREISEVARNNKAQAVVLGSYGVGGSSVYVNMKIVSPGNNTVLAAYDYVLPYNGEIRSMLTRTK